MTDAPTRHTPQEGPCSPLEAAVAAATEVLQGLTEALWVDVKAGDGLLRIRPDGLGLAFRFHYRPRQGGGR